MAHSLPGHIEVDDDEEWSRPFEQESNKKNDQVQRNHVKNAKVSAHDRTVIHFDVDCFYAQVEMLRNPELRLKPLGIQQKNIVVTCNYVAREYGVTKLMYVSDAMKKCPQLVLVSGEDLTNYRHTSYQISEFLKKYTPHVERLGFDENFVDVSELVKWRQIDGDFKPTFYGHEFKKQREMAASKCDCGCEQRIQIGSQIAADIREALQKELGITCCAGIAHNKVLAKLVAGTHKPNQQTSILPHLAQDLVLSLPSPRCIPGIGSKMHKRIQAQGISTIGDLQKADPLVLANEFGPETAQTLLKLSFGVDHSPVIAFSPPQTLSDEDSFKCCNSYQDAERRIRDLLASLMKRIAEDGRIPQTVRLSIRRAGLHSNYRESRQTAVPGNVFRQFHTSGSIGTAEKEMLPIVMGLFKKLVEPKKHFHLTLINVCFAKLVKQDSGPLTQFFSKHNLKAENCDPSSFDYCKIANCGDERVKMDDTHELKNDMQEESNSHLVNKAGTSKSVKAQSQLIDFSKKIKDAGSFFSVLNEDKCKMKKTVLADKEQDSDGNVEKSPILFSKVQSDSEAKPAVSSTRQTTCPLAPTTESSAACFEKKEIHFLKNILPNDIDAEVVMQLPCPIQKEILAQHGILMEELPEGRHFSLISNSVLTRSQANQTVFSTARKRPLFSPRKSVGSNVSNTEKVKRIRERESFSSEDMPVKDSGTHIMLNFSEKNVRTVESMVGNVEIQTEPSALKENLKMNPSLFQSTEVNVVPDIVTGNTFMSKSQGKMLETDTDQNVIHDAEKEKLQGRDLRPPANQTQIQSTLKRSETLLGEETEPSSTAHSHIPKYEPNNSQDIHTCQKSFVNKEMDPSQKSPPASRFTESPNCSKITGKMSLPQFTLKKLPKDINPEVFAQLPNDIRGEIMAHVLMGTPVTYTTGVGEPAFVSVKDTKTTSSKPPTVCKRHNAKSSSSQKSLLNYFSSKDK
ncbi:DNA polymerase iota [Plakobranchus ocellatus]|uniref:DNA polymerase iota n=1 Tax=Plakobranchus ocellatus TaxID=259542 RepID=A0AAV4CXB6_9GAST|nr:DNA polymerase iota [Plakobranchus ocellatus]